MFRSTISVFFVTLLALFASIASAAPLRKRLSGRGTFFEVGLGACGTTSSDSDFIVALSEEDYGDGEYCGKTISITANGVTSTATVEDKCPSCSSGSLDMSPSLFQTFAEESVGVVTVTWNLPSA